LYGGEPLSENTHIDDDDNGDEIGDITGFEWIHMASKQWQSTFEELEQTHDTDVPFCCFRTYLSKFLSNSLLSHGIQLPDNRRIQLMKDDTVCNQLHIPPLTVLTSIFKITEYCALKVDYKSNVDWWMTTDILCCNPYFHKHARYDVMLQTVNGPIFGVLVFLFICAVGTTEHPIALVQPYDAYSRPPWNKDRDCGFFQICAKPCSKTEFFFVQSIIHGVYIVPDFEEQGDFFVDDLIDEDMFLQMEMLHT
jgi:hypothetical protein